MAKSQQAFNKIEKDKLKQEKREEKNKKRDTEISLLCILNLGCTLN